MATAIRRGVLLLGVAAAWALCLAGADDAPASTRLKGTLIVGHGDDFQHGRETPYVQLRTSRAKIYPLRFSGSGARRFARRIQADPRRYAGKRVSVRVKRRQSRKLVVSRARSLRAPARASAASATGPRTVAGLIVNFQGEPAPWTLSQLRDTMFGGTSSLRGYYDELSQGRIHLIGRDDADGGDVYGPVSVPLDPALVCNSGTWQTAALADAVRQGFDLGDYDNIVFATPDSEACPSLGGYGDLNGRYSTVLGGHSVRLFAHELGHNLGLNHANRLECKVNGVRVSLSGDCDATAYGDPFDVMGLGNMLFSAQRRMQLGVSTGTAELIDSGTRTLSPSEPGVAGLQRLRALRSVDAQGKPYSWFDIETRRRSGFFDAVDVASPVATGATIRVTKAFRDSDGELTTAEDPNSFLVDTTPTTAGGGSGASDAPLLSGRTVTDQLSGVTISVTASDAIGTTVSLTRSKPAPFDPELEPHVEASSDGQTLTYSAVGTHVSHDIHVYRRPSQGTFEITNPGRVATPNNPCTGVGDSIHCPSAGINRIEVIGGELDDRIEIDSSVGSGPEVSIAGTSGNDTIIATDGDDVLSGGNGRDTISSGGGNDVLDGGRASDNEGLRIRETEDDALDGGSGADMLIGRAGNDTIDGGPDVDTVNYERRTVGVRVDLRRGRGGQAGERDTLAGVENAITGQSKDIIYGDTGPNSFATGDGSDKVKADAGDDLIEAGPGNDRVYGGTGIDTVSYADHEQSVSVSLDGRSSGYPGEGDRIKSDVENLVGGKLNDTLVGNSSNNLIEGGPGADSISGVAGVDSASYADHNRDGVVVHMDSLANDGAGGGLEGDKVGSDIENVVGSPGRDWLVGDANPNVIHGGNGNDLIDGGGGADQLHGDSDLDTVTYKNHPSGVDFTDDALANDGRPGEADNVFGDVEAVIGSNFKDTLIGYDPATTPPLETMTLDGGDGSDLLMGDGDTLNGGPGNDTIDGSRAVNVTTLAGGPGDDTITGGIGIDRLYGEEDNDTLDGGGAFPDQLFGGSGNNSVSYAGRQTGKTVDLGQQIQGLPGEFDILTDISGAIGGDGPDTLIGDVRPNELTGGAGADTLLGNGGEDRFHARDGEDDVIDCGSDNAFDHATADRSPLDVATNCSVFDVILRP